MFKYHAVMSAFLVAGSIAYDLLLSYDGSFADGIEKGNMEELSVAYVMQRLKRLYGGTAANIAWNLRLLDQNAYITGSVGTDGDEYLERLKEKGVNVSLVRRDTKDVSPTAIIGTDTGERQITFYHPGADQRSQPPDLSSIMDTISLVLISPHSPIAMEQTAARCEIGRAHV